MSYIAIAVQIWSHHFILKALADNWHQIFQHTQIEKASIFDYCTQHLVCFGFIFVHSVGWQWKNLSMKKYGYTINYYLITRQHKYVFFFKYLRSFPTKWEISHKISFPCYNQIHIDIQINHDFVFGFRLIKIWILLLNILLIIGVKVKFNLIFCAIYTFISFRKWAKPSLT